jgi:hypothetical protein
LRLVVVAADPTVAGPLSDLIARADGELYRAKRSDRRTDGAWLPPVVPAPVAVPIAAA